MARYRRHDKNIFILIQKGNKCNIFNSNSVMFDLENFNNIATLIVLYFYKGNTQDKKRKLRFLRKKTKLHKQNYKIIH